MNVHVHTSDSTTPIERETSTVQGFMPLCHLFILMKEKY